MTGQAAEPPYSSRGALWIAGGAIILRASRPPFRSFIEKTDLFLYDLKIMSAEEHRKYTGISNSRILGNLEILARQGVKITVRMPVIPGINAGERNLSLLGSFLSDLPGAKDIHLLPYHCAAKGKYEKLDLT